MFPQGGLESAEGRRGCGGSGVVAQTALPALAQGSSKQVGWEAQGSGQGWGSGRGRARA